MEVWGGATFDSCMRYLNKDPWERLRILKKHLPNTKLQMLLRGQSILGYKHYSEDVVTEFVKREVANGISMLDTAISSLALQTSQPTLEPLVETIRGTPSDTGLDLKLAYEIASYFKKVRENYKDMESNIQGIDTRVLTYQIPGGMLSNLAFQLKQLKAEDKYEEVLKEIPRVRKELGYPPLVTPTSQIVGTQATLNVILKERYKMIPEEVRKYLMGFYGRPPAPIDSEIMKKQKLKKVK